MNICITMSASGSSAHDVSYSDMALEKICELLKSSSRMLEKVFPLRTKLLLLLLTSTLTAGSQIS